MSKITVDSSVLFQHTANDIEFHVIDRFHFVGQIISPGTTATLKQKIMFTPLPCDFESAFYRPILQHLELYNSQMYTTISYSTISNTREEQTSCETCNIKTHTNKHITYTCKLFSKPQLTLWPPN